MTEQQQATVNHVGVSDHALVKTSLTLPEPSTFQMWHTRRIVRDGLSDKEFAEILLPKDINSTRSIELSSIDDKWLKWKATFTSALDEYATSVRCQSH